MLATFHGKVTGPYYCNYCYHNYTMGNDITLDVYNTTGYLQYKAFCFCNEACFNSFILSKM